MHQIVLAPKQNKISIRIDLTHVINGLEDIGIPHQTRLNTVKKPHVWGFKSAYSKGMLCLLFLAMIIKVLHLHSRLRSNLMKIKAHRWNLGRVKSIIWRSRLCIFLKSTYLVYTILHLFGYFQWRKSWPKNNALSPIEGISAMTFH